MGAIAEEEWVNDVLTFWFEELTPRDWFIKNTATDAEIRRRFLGLYRKLAGDGALSDLKTARSCLAAVIVLDQFSRNMFRGKVQSFATDAQALALCEEAVARGIDRDLAETQRKFLYMPYMHSEDASVQGRSVELFSSLNDPDTLDYARRHKDVIDRFGRFPHRNEILGRSSTPDEKIFLQQPGSRF